ncbi:MAG: T9SS type A sorting domain-containing protein, partial [Crocinitomicaceae bacterium]|nr:T9SS type A sorting domain-containing protein [Crocinitomicaceae bacterium]
PTFDICTSVPQANDICSDAIDIDGVSSTGNFCQANTDVESAETCNIGSGCNSCAITSETTDLWHAITMDPGNADQILEVDLTFLNATDAAVVTLYAGCFSNSQMDDAGAADCAIVSSTGAGSTITHTFLSTITEGGFGPDWYIRVAPVSGNAICGFDIEARRVAENNDCSQFQNVFPGFDIETPQLVDFDYSSDSPSAPSITGSDLWYQFDPNSGTDNGSLVYSTSADINVNGLGAGEEITLLIYEGNGISANNCLNLSSDYLTSITINSNGTELLNCLNEIHGPTDGGYLVRVIQSAGGASASPTVTVTASAQVGKFNNSCVNIWDGNSPTNLGTSDAAHQFNAYYILDGETISGDFSGTTDCDAEVTSSLCSGVSNEPFSDANERDLWYIFRVPNSTCPGLSVSTVINSMNITYDASSSFRDAKLYVYSNCGDADLLACSGTLDGAGGSWAISGLNQGAYYLLRVKPSSLNSDFDYSFDITVNEGAVQPCNNEGTGAENLAVNSCNNYPALSTYSMQGADDSPSTGVPESDVWFTFTAPSPANGGPYFNANKSWVTVFLENVSGTSAGHLYMQLYAAPTSIVATATTYSTTSTAGSQTFGHFGHLNPGQTYYLRIYHKEVETAPVDYKVNLYTPNANETAWSCGNNNASFTSGCSEGCNDLREAYFKIDLPEGTLSNHYYMIEVVGEDQIIDFELRSQFLTESSATEGDFDDYDLPCSSRPLEPGVSMVNETLGITVPTTGESCNLNGIAADGGEGVRRVYYGMNGPAAGMKDYYYIKVFMDPSDPNYATTTGLKICTINFNGPYSTEVLADAGGTTDLTCASTSLGVELIIFYGEVTAEFNRIKWETASEMNNSHFVLESSIDGIVFSEIAIIDGNGTTSNNNDYSYDHRKSNAKNYYRLKQFDFDGSVTVSDVIYLESTNLGVNLFPNPVEQGKKFVITSDEIMNGWEVHNSLGVLIQHGEGLKVKSLVIDDIKEPGIYFVSIIIGSQRIVRKLIVK